MKRLRFDAPPHHRLVVEGKDEPIAGGEEFDLPNEEADALLRQTHVSVSEVPIEKKPKATGEGRESRKEA